MRVIMLIWVNRHGDIKTDKVQFDQTLSDEMALERYAPSTARCDRLNKNGYSLSNWHIIEDNTAESRSVVI